MSTLSKKNRPALLLIDIQKGLNELDYYGGERNNPDAEMNAARLLDFWRKQNLPLIHVQHCSITPASPLVEGKPGHAFKDIVMPAPGETVIKKNVNSAFIGTDLKERLDSEAITQLVLAGLTTEHCISSTARMAANFGYDTFLASDAMAAFNKKGVDGQLFPAELIHTTTLATLNNEFATVRTTDELLESLAKD